MAFCCNMLSHTDPGFSIPTAGRPERKQNLENRRYDCNSSVLLIPGSKQQDTVSQKVLLTPYSCEIKKLSLEFVISFFYLDHAKYNLFF